MDRTSPATATIELRPDGVNWEFRLPGSPQWLPVETGPGGDVLQLGFYGAAKLAKAYPQTVAEFL